MTFWKGYLLSILPNLTGQYRKFIHTEHFLTREGRRLLRQKRQKELGNHTIESRGTHISTSN